jgi:hypothetical protein
MFGWNLSVRARQLRLQRSELHRRVHWRCLRLELRGWRVHDRLRNKRGVRHHVRERVELQHRLRSRAHLRDDLSGDAELQRRLPDGGRLHSRLPGRRELPVSRLHPDVPGRSRSLQLRQRLSRVRHVLTATG